MSDMAANATGHKKTDHLRIMGLAEAAADFAREVLAPGGAFVAKVFQGGTEGAAPRRSEARLRGGPPRQAGREPRNSAELYVLATGFRRTPSPARETFAK